MSMKKVNSSGFSGDMAVKFDFSTADLGVAAGVVSGLSGSRVEGFDRKAFVRSHYDPDNLVAWDVRAQFESIKGSENPEMVRSFFGSFLNLLGNVFDMEQDFKLGGEGFSLNQGVCSEHVRAYMARLSGQFLSEKGTGFGLRDGQLDSVNETMKRSPVYTVDVGGLDRFESVSDWVQEGGVASIGTQWADASLDRTYAGVQGDQTVPMLAVGSCGDPHTRSHSCVKLLRFGAEGHYSLDGFEGSMKRVYEQDTVDSKGKVFDFVVSESEVGPTYREMGSFSQDEVRVGYGMSSPRRQAVSYFQSKFVSFFQSFFLQEGGFPSTFLFGSGERFLRESQRVNNGFFRSALLGMDSAVRFSKLRDGMDVGCDDSKLVVDEFAVYCKDYLRASFDKVFGDVGQLEVFCDGQNESLRIELTDVLGVYKDSFSRFERLRSQRRADREREDRRSDSSFGGVVSYSLHSSPIHPNSWVSPHSVSRYEAEFALRSCSQYSDMNVLRWSEWLPENKTDEVVAFSFLKCLSDVGSRSAAEVVHRHMIGRQVDGMKKWFVAKLSSQGFAVVDDSVEGNGYDSREFAIHKLIPGSLPPKLSPSRDTTYLK